MSAMISIDFGNSYTKVGIRPDRNELSHPMSDQSLQWDDHNICIPSLAARIERNGKERWYFGTDVMQLAAKTPNMQVYRNWKPEFFRGVESNLDQSIAVPVLAGSANAARHADTGANDQTIKECARMLGISPASEDAFKAFVELLRTSGGKQADTTIVETETTEPEYKQIAKGFFEWLRGFIEPLCQKRGVDLLQTPTRITLPSFGSQTAAEQLLVEILGEAGWRTEERNPALPEPLANSIGTFTEGRNIVWHPGGSVEECPHYGRMFSGSTIFQELRKVALRQVERSIHWAMVVDVGGYTTDFAMVGFDLEDIETQFDGRHEGRRRLSTFSQPLGVRMLDQRVRDALPEPKREAFREMEADPDHRRIESFHRVAYGSLRPYKTQRFLIGQNEEEKKRLRQSLHDFADEIADYAEKFLEIEQYDCIDELILTGGGCSIPIVRKTVRERLLKYGQFHAHLPAGEKEALPADCDRLGSLWVRGATAAGGTSVYFDFASTG